MQGETSLQQEGTIQEQPREYWNRTRMLREPRNHWISGYRLFGQADKLVVYGNTKCPATTLGSNVVPKILQGMSDWLEHSLHIYQVQSTTQTRRKFRQVARDTCGESMEPPDENLIMFGEIAEEKDPVVCVVCAKLARNDVEDTTNTEFYHWINFLFVKGDFQRHGYGSLLLNAIERELRLRTLRPIRVESAFKAVQFFKTHGYRNIGEPIDCVFAGSALFRTLQTMEKFSVQPNS